MLSSRAFPHHVSDLPDEAALRCRAEFTMSAKLCRLASLSSLHLVSSSRTVTVTGHRAKYA